MSALIASELRQRVRGKRWWVLLAVWVGVLTGLIALIRRAIISALAQSPDPQVEVGAIMFGSLALLILALSCLVVPSMTATAINGERDRGTLAVLQASLVRPWEIVGAKFIAGLVTFSAFLLATLPIALWSVTEGGVGVGRVAVVYVVLLVVAAVFLMGGLAASAVARRPALSAVSAYGVVAFLTVGTLILFGVSYATAPMAENTFEPDIGPRWLILAPNPFVVLADASPASEGRIDDPLSGIRAGVRDLRTPPETFTPVEPLEAESPTPPRPPPSVWPAGLAIEALVAALAGAIAVARLRVPMRRLPRGERIA